MNQHARTILQAKLGEERFHITHAKERLQQLEVELDKARQEITAFEQRIEWLEEALGERTPKK